MTAEALSSLLLRGAPVPDDLWDPADCRALWIAALEMYLRDAIAAAKGSEHREAVAALHDLRGGCEMLA
ncbi:hypothetical protein, partial [Staphylococcus aureus]|uniref:hypothetical protein n=1 Tax=Staphylococcus aureus TaxID=1280 RepID=UPI00301E27AF